MGKEKHCAQKYDVSCIMTMPHYQRRGYGRLLIDFSYLLSKAERQAGTPEKALSDLGRVSYYSYWKSVILEYIHHHRRGKQITIQGIQAETSMHPQDIALTFMLLGFIRKNMQNKFVLALDWNKINQHMQKVEKSLKYRTRVNLDPDRLRWTPMLSSPLHYNSGSPFKTLNPESPDTPETPKTVEKIASDKKKARQNLSSTLKSEEKKDKKSTMSNRVKNKKDSNKKNKLPARARARGASSTVTTTTDDTSDEDEQEEDVSHVTPRKKKGKNNQDSINSDDEDQNNTQGTAGKKGSNKRASSRGKNATANENNGRKNEKTKNNQTSKGKKNTTMAVVNEIKKRGGKQRIPKMSNQSGECLGMDGGTNLNIKEITKKQKKIKNQHVINYHFQENVKQRKLFLNKDDSDDDYDFKHAENGFEFESSTTGIRTQSRYSPTSGDSSKKSLYSRGCIGDLLYLKKSNPGTKKSTSPKIKKRKPSVKEFPDKEDTDIDADVEDELDDADSVQSSSSLILSSKSSKLQQQQQKGINQHQTLISQQTKSISPQLMTTTNLSPKLNQTLQDKTTEKTLFEAKNKLLDTREQILNQKPRQPSNHYRNARTLNATNRVKTDINLKPVVKRAAANKASDKIAKDSAALNRSLDRSFS